MEVFMKKLVLFIVLAIVIGGCAVVPIAPNPIGCGDYGYRCDQYGYCGQMWIPGPCYPSYSPPVPYYAPVIPYYYGGYGYHGGYHGGWHGYRR